MYKNSAREVETLRYFREMLQRRNVTKNVKHFEECEQLFVLVGKCYAVEALLNFFGMSTESDPPRKNSPPYRLMSVEEHRIAYWDGMLDNFINEHLITPDMISVDGNTRKDETPSVLSSESPDLVREYSLLLLKYYFLFADIKDAVKKGNGQRINQLHKQLLHHFKTDSGYNAYGIEMFISIIQNEVLLSEEEAYQCTWAATANWTGGKEKNLEIDLMQENRNLKKLIKSMGANKTDKAIERASKAVGGVRKVMQNFDAQAAIHAKSTAHGHKYSSSDERKIMKDLRNLKPFTHESDRKHDAFPSVSSDPLCDLEEVKFNDWLKRHTKNLLYNVPTMEADVESDDESEG